MVVLFIRHIDRSWNLDNVSNTIWKQLSLSVRATLRMHNTFFRFLECLYNYLLKDEVAFARPRSSVEHLVSDFHNRKGHRKKLS